jgi:hypothetical protein
MHSKVVIIALIFPLMGNVMAAPPKILTLQGNGSLVWTSDFTNGVAVIERSTNTAAGPWWPFYYDVASNFQPVPVTLYDGTAGYYATNYNGGSNNVRVTRLPAPTAPMEFYRLGIQTNPPDPSLVVHLTFDNDLSDGFIVDTSGHNNHALQYSSTNWPGQGPGPDGSRAGVFGGPRPVPPPLDPDYSQGEYAGIPYSPSFDHLTNGTVLAWAFYHTNSYHNSTIVDPSAYGTDHGSWYLGRTYTYNTLFALGIGNGQNDEYIALNFPDYAPDGTTTGGWHYYGVTWDGTNIIGYFDGLAFGTNSQAGYPELVVGTAQWMAIGCKVHGGTPQWGDPDVLPNWGWLGGGIDDVRVYNRALKPSAISNLYASFDKQPPTAPVNVTAKVDSSSQVEIRWGAAADNFRVDGYRLLRDGVAIFTNPVPVCYVDTGLSANTTYTYTVQAFDPAGNLSNPSTPAQATTAAPGGPVEVIVDNADGFPWVTTNGGPWTVYTGSTYTEFYGKDFLTCSGSGTGSVVFRPSLPESGNYNVYFWHPATPFWYLFSDTAPVDIVTGGTTNTVSVDERSNFGKWDLLGTFAFSAGTNSFVQVRPAPGASDTPADAVRFVK